MKKIWLFIFLFVGVFQSFAISQEKFDQANRSFAEGKFEVALADYQSILEKEGVSSELLYNFANAQLKAGQTGKAILNYERVLRFFSPHDPDVIANLRAARNQAGLLEPKVSLLQNIGGWLTWNDWAYFSFAVLFLLCVLAGVRFAKPSASWTRWLSIVNAIFILLFIFSLVGMTTRWLERNDAVIISEKAVVRISPFDTAELSFPVKQGEIVKVEKSYGNFDSIRNSIGKSGWIAKDQIEKIIP